MKRKSNPFPGAKRHPWTPARYARAKALLDEIDGKKDEGSTGVECRTGASEPCKAHGIDYVRIRHRGISR